MNKRFISIIGALTLLFSQAAFARAAVETAVLKNTRDRIVIDYRFQEFQRRTIEIDGREFSQILLGKESLKKEVGVPALPDVSRSLIVPDERRMEIRVIESSFYELEGIDIVPSRGYILRETNPADVPYTFGSVYDIDAFYPDKLAELSKPFIIRDHRGITATVNSFQYNPVKRVLRIYTEMSVEVKTAGPSTVNVMERKDIPVSVNRSFRDIYRSLFINYGLDTSYEPLIEEGKMLIIAYDEWQDEMQPLIDHKNGLGITTTITGISEIGNDAGYIKDYIQSVYEAPGERLAYVLLVGDVDHVAVPYYGTYAADPLYSLLAGDDSYPEIIVGRFSAESDSDVVTQVRRTVEYEETPAWDTDWFLRAMGIGSDEGPGDDGELDREHIDNIRDDLLEHGYTVVDQIYDPEATDDEVTAGLNAGRGLINYCGHGGWAGWNTSGFNIYDIEELTNHNELPFIVSCACHNGRFDEYTCFAEVWMRTQDMNEPTGAIGVYAASRGQYWDPPMAAQDEIVDLFVNGMYSTFGALCYAGSCLMMHEYPEPYPIGGGIVMFYSWILFGDPSLRVVDNDGMKVSPPANFYAEGPEGGPFSPVSITYTLTNNGPEPLNYDLISNAEWIDVIEDRGLIPPAGSVQVVISVNSHAQNLPDGIYEDDVQFVNLTSHLGDTTRKVTLDVCTPELIYEFNLDENPGWQTEGEWEFGVPQGQGGDHYGYPDPAEGATGYNVYGINLRGDYETQVNCPYYLTSDPLDCSNLRNVTLHFQRRLNTDCQPYVINGIDVSNNGYDWLSIWRNPFHPDDITENAWTEQVYDISAVADREPCVYIRWIHEIGDDEAFPYSGWNIDDIQIWGGREKKQIPACSFIGIFLLIFASSCFLNKNMKR